MDIFLRDEEEGITTYYQIEVFGEFVKPLVERLHKGDHISITGNLAVHRFVGKDGKEVFSLLIKNAEMLRHHESVRPCFFYLKKRLPDYLKKPKDQDEDSTSNDDATDEYETYDEPDSGLPF